MVEKYYKEIIVFTLQIFMFYIFPLFSGVESAIGMVVLILLATLIFGIVMGYIDSKIKWFYPVIVGLLFIPSIFIYYNSSAFIHCIWYLVNSFIGVLIGYLSMEFIN